MRTAISSLSTRVPPVTADRSPPDSRITGADSPVIADSSTVAMPSMISPSPGMTSPALTRQTSPRSSCDEGFSEMVPSAARTRAVVSARVLRKVSAWALPRPSAMASAKLANSTVNHSHALTRPAKRFCFEVLSLKSRMNRIVVNTEPTSTMNITGLRIIFRGLSFLKESTIAVRTIAGSKIDFEAACFMRTFGGRGAGGVMVAVMVWRSSH
jgi:hypothetical protein